jgi:hypothetical protein
MCLVWFRTRTAEFAEWTIKHLTFRGRLIPGPAAIDVDLNEELMMPADARGAA